MKEGKNRREFQKEVVGGFLGLFFTPNVEQLITSAIEEPEIEVAEINQEGEACITGSFNTMASG